jgi:hypothetical protein
MSAMPPIAPELMRWGELTRCARSGHVNPHLQEGPARAAAPRGFSFQSPYECEQICRKRLVSRSDVIHLRHVVVPEQLFEGRATVVALT